MDPAGKVERSMQEACRSGRVVLITGDEMGELFGQEVAASIAELDNFGREAGICASCGGACCADIGCELYVPQFGQCPIYEYRPLLCRFHFCYRFDAKSRDLVIRLRDFFLRCYTAVSCGDSAMAKSWNIPPLKEACPEFISAAGIWVEAVRDGKLHPERGVELILQEAEKYRKACSDSIAT